MTLYAYRCTAAGHDVEAFWPMGQAPEHMTCPDHGCPARRLLARGAFATIAGAHNATYRRTCE